MESLELIRIVGRQTGRKPFRSYLKLRCQTPSQFRPQPRGVQLVDLPPEQLLHLSGRWRRGNHDRVRVGIQER